MNILMWTLTGMTVAFVLTNLWQRMTGFTAQRQRDYETGQPQFDLRTHLSGPIRCEGVIYGPFGRVTSRFTGDFDAEWQGNHGVMKERFVYDSGTEQDREWRLELGNDGAIRAEADDVVGLGEGNQNGSAVQLRYRLRLPEKAGGHVLSVTDWMYLTPSGAIVNRSQFHKFGIKVAELVATMRRLETRE